MADENGVFDPIQHLELFDDINSYICDDLSCDLLCVNSKKCHTEADVKALWNHFHSPGVRVDGLVDSYEEFKKQVLCE